eukprot:jgi/Mesvir1/8345/Mv25350-RA.1
MRMCDRPDRASSTTPPSASAPHLDCSDDPAPLMRTWTLACPRAACPCQAL